MPVLPRIHVPLALELRTPRACVQLNSLLAQANDDLVAGKRT